MTPQQVTTLRLLAVLLGAVTAISLLVWTTDRSQASDAVRSCRPFVISNFHDEYGPHPFRAWDVRRSSDLRCSMARKLLKAAYGAGPLKIIRKVYEGGGSGRPTYWLKDGWRCGNGAGGASCFNEYKLGFNDIDFDGISLAVTASTG